MENSESKKNASSVRNIAHSIREYSIGEEIANAITHGVGIGLAIAALALSCIKAIGDGGGMLLFCALVYTISMLIEYSMSTMYHALVTEKAKRVFKVLDHCCIYLFIAGSYTPFCLIPLADAGGFYLCLFVWIVALIGVTCEAFWTFRPRWISAAIYLLLGWSVVWFLPQLLAALPIEAFWLLVAGGIVYSLGCIFYVLKKIPYMHSVFHLFVLGGSVLQFLATYLYIL